MLHLRWRRPCYEGLSGVSWLRISKSIGRSFAAQVKVKKHTNSPRAGNTIKHPKHPKQSSVLSYAIRMCHNLIISPRIIVSGFAAIL